MAKSKNHTNHNQNRKAHRNGIRRPNIKKLIVKMKGHVDQKFMKNLKFARKHNKKIYKSVVTPKPKYLKPKYKMAQPKAKTPKVKPEAPKKTEKPVQKSKPQTKDKSKTSGKPAKK